MLRTCASVHIAKVFGDLQTLAISISQTTPALASSRPPCSVPAPNASPSFVFAWAEDAAA